MRVGGGSCLVRRDENHGWLWCWVRLREEIVPVDDRLDGLVRERMTRKRLMKWK